MGVDGTLDGATVCKKVGLLDGAELTGGRDGAFECDVVGFELGDVLGDADSDILGDDDGSIVGSPDGCAVGDVDGRDVG